MEVRSNCPECIKRKGSPDTGMHLYYNTLDSIWFCFRCQWSGHGENPNPEHTREYSPHDPIEKPSTRRQLYPLLANEEEKKSLFVRMAKTYLEKHHIDPLEASWQYKLFLDQDWLVFPVWQGDFLLFWQKRHLFSKRFLNPPVESKPVFWTEHPNQSPVLVVESFMNAVRASKRIRACCTFGKNIGDSAAADIVSKAKSLILCFDAGEFSASFRAARVLYAHGAKRVRVRMIPGQEGRDLCDLTEQTLRKVLRG